MFTARCTAHSAPIPRPTRSAVLQVAHSDFEMASRTLTALPPLASARIAELEAALRLEMERRHEEELRALLEGAPFVMHRGNDKMLRHVWVADVAEKRMAVVRWQSNRGVSLRRYVPGEDRVKIAKSQYHEANVALLVSVTYGARPRLSVQKNILGCK